MNRTAGNIMHDICHDWAVYISYYFKGLLLLTINLLMFLFIILCKTFRGKFCYFSICAGYFARQSNSTVVSETNWKEFVYLTLFFPLRRRIYFSLQFGYYSMIRPTFSSLVAYYVPKCWVQKHVMAYMTLVAQPEPVVLETELIHGSFFTKDLDCPKICHAQFLY